MAKVGKKYTAAKAKVTKPAYTLDEALALVKSAGPAKFDETVEIHMRLGVDPSKADQALRGAVVLPSGTGRKIRVAVVAQGEKAKEAEGAGADAVGGEDLIEKINGGWFEFDTLISTPDMMGKVAKVGRVLGPKGLMPNPKTGTVTFDVGQAVRDAKAGKVEYRIDKGSNIHATIGKKSFSPEALGANFKAFVDAIQRAKPNTAKGVYLKKVVIASTMGPGITIDSSVYRS